MKKLKLPLALLFAVAVLTSGPLTCLADDLVEFIKWEKVFEKKEFGTSKERGPDVDEVGPGYKIGTFKKGKYKGYDFVFSFYSVMTACKGGPCPTSRNRFAKKGNRLVFFPKISWKIYIDEVVSKFEQHGFEVTVDDSFSIPALEYHEKINGPKKDQTLTFDIHDGIMEGTLESEPDLSNFKKIFRHDTLGDVYTAIPNDDARLPILTSRDRIWESKVAQNKFFIFRPDQTFLRYQFTPTFTDQKIKWTDKALAKDGGPKYTLTMAPCQEPHSYKIIPADRVKIKTDLKKSGSASNGDPIYTLKKGHPLLQEFYEEYSKNHEEATRYGTGGGALLSEAEFANAHPLIFKVDPFDRLIPALNLKFAMPCFAEPIIYLYPTIAKNIQVQVPKLMNITASIPTYDGLWNIHADPTGKLKDLRDGRTHSRLFWEGWAMLVAPPTKGFVVKKEEVSKFFNETLPKMGLNAVEIKDFIEAWLPRFSNAPYYLISFLDPALIEKIAPLTLNPKPDSVIRVYMDYQPLENPRDVEPVDLPKAEDRNGFTMVEWGGFTR